MQTWLCSLVKNMACQKRLPHFYACRKIVWFIYLKSPHGATLKIFSLDLRVQWNRFSKFILKTNDRDAGNRIFLALCLQPTVTVLVKLDLCFILHAVGRGWLPIVKSCNSKTVIRDNVAKRLTFLFFFTGKMINSIF